MRAADGITYGKLIWQYDPVEALTEANRRIAATREDPSATWLFLSDLSALEALPSDIEHCQHLKRLTLGDSKAPDGREFLAYEPISDAVRYAFLDAERTFVNSRSLDSILEVSALKELEIIDLRSTQVVDLTPLSGLGNLQSLYCSSTQVVDLTPLSELNGLQRLDCGYTPVVDLTPLTGLSGLQRLNFRSTQVVDLKPLSGLNSLQRLDCNNILVVDLTPLSGLSSLRSLDCSRTEVVDLTPLSELTNLQSLDCNNTQVVDLTPLSGLSNLRSLDCSRTEVVDLAPLSELTNLQSLDCRSTQVVDLTPLSGLSNLQSLDCSRTEVVDLTSLSELTNLQSLDCRSTQIVDLTPLSGLSNLQNLNCSNTPVVDLMPLSGLSNIQSLYCVNTRVVDLMPLSELGSLQSLDCRSTQVVDLTPLSGLSNLQSLDCNETPVVDLAPLSGLSNLQSLACIGTPVIDLTPLSGLSCLQRLDCDSTQVVDLTPLSELTNLRSLDCRSTQVVDLTPLSGLICLQSLDCRSTQVVDLTPLSGLSSLQSLCCNNTPVADLMPLSDLGSLQRLECNNTPVSDLTPLSGLSNLRSLHCSSTQVVDLTPLTGLSSLQRLDCDNTQVVDLMPLTGLSSFQSLNCSRLKLANTDSLLALIDKIIFVDLVASNLRVPGVPDEVFGSNTSENCLERVRAHVADLGADPQVLDTVKLIVLGNGRIGKTQICNRLRDLPFEEEADSTHGIHLVDAPIPDREGAFRVWDFGGQEIYHGTHALFLRSRAVFLLVWTPDTDNSDEDIPAHGMRFRNRPLGWWLDFVQRFGDADTPLIVVQNQIDLDGEYDRGDHPDLQPLRKNLSFCRALAMSAQTKEGLPALNDALHHAADNFNPPLIGAGRLSVMNTLRDMLKADQARTRDERENRTLSMTEFKEICDATGGISSPEQFLSFLHNAGEVFWNRGQDEYAIILDQAWALDAIYAVYDRKKCWPKLQQSQGRFTRLHMGSFLWDKEGYSIDEQKLFLSFMCQSGICFKTSGRVEDDTAVYIAPDGLPERLDIGHPPPMENANAGHSYAFDQIAPGFMRSLLVSLGSEAGVHGNYWRSGFTGFEKEHRTQVRVELIQPADGDPELHIAAKGSKADEIVSQLGKLCSKSMQLFKMTPKDDAPPQPKSDLKMTFAPDPDGPNSFFVSYAWADETNPDRAKIVDDFCARAEAEGVHIRRDKDEVQFGQSISEFMAKLIEGDRVLIVLSDKYLRSVPCMTELYQIWNNSGHDRDQFKSRVRLFTAPDAKIWSPVDRAKVGKFWQDRYDEEKPWINNMGDNDRLAHNQLKRFYTHVPDILELISDVLQPRDLDDLIEYALD